jgi:uncharacterized membrane protein YccC
MSTVISRQSQIERVVIEATSLLVERARIELEQEVEAGGGASSGTAAGHLGRMRQLENELRAIRQQLGLLGAGRTTAAPERQISRFYEVPGQEDA